MSITIDQYFGVYCKHPDATDSKWTAADKLLDTVNALLAAAEECGVTVQVNPRTGSQISGAENGGFRPGDCSVGASKSKHKTGHAVDIYDPGDELDAWLNDGLLKQFGLWREHPDATPNWVHLQDLPPNSGKRTFVP